MNVFGVDGNEIEVTGLGRLIHENGRAGKGREYLCFADGLDGKRYLVLVQPDCAAAVATVEGMPGKVKMLPEIETTRFDGFPEFPAWESPQLPADWLQELISNAS